MKGRVAAGEQLPRATRPFSLVSCPHWGGPLTLIATIEDPEGDANIPRFR